MLAFVTSDKLMRDKRCEEILNIQCMGLKKRLEHTGCKHAVIGILGGLDSTLALLVIVRAFDILNIPHENIETITMPCFGTTSRTYDAATILKWLKIFYKRFFSQQFKRSCIPDGPKVGSVALSPRGDLRMPSDASVDIWMGILDKLEYEFAYIIEIL